MAKRHNSVYSKIAAELAREIEDGKYEIDTCIPSERELKERFGVERTTVRRALELLSADGYVEKRAGIGSVVVSREDGNAAAAKSVGNTVKVAAKGTVKQSRAKGTLLYVFPNADCKERAKLSVIGGTVKSLEKLCRDNGVGFKTVEGSELLSDLKIKDIAGAVFSEKTDEGCVKLLKENGIPYVLAFGREKGVQSVGTDVEGASELVAETLCKAGHKKIAFIGSGGEYYFENKIRALFERALLQNGAELDPELTVKCVGYDENSGCAAMKRLLSRARGGFTAVCAENSQIAHGAVRAVEEAGMSVPSEISVMAFSSAERDAEISAAYFDTKSLAALIFRAVTAQREIPCDAAFCAEIGCEQTGGTVSEAKEKSSRREMSDFLL